jgi:ornithine cyclodeaminase/alanine dehydrogenase-like protein (mu-crystallin family)
MRFVDREEVARRLTYDLCIPIVRHAMIALSKGETKQLLRSIIPLSDGRIFGIMPGAMGAHAPFGAKLISVSPENFARGIQSHQGLVILFDPETGAPVCVVHACEITAIRTAAASAVATDALARKNARRLTLPGYGEQAALPWKASVCETIPSFFSSRARLGLKPLSAQAHYLLAGIFQASGDQVEAQQHYQECSSIN